ncbi:hypothetical protein FACS1894219_04360 [Clostridia bacterium]|nr:hypothetical protein FACS1894219_04360 [Clostridia bacterium]
MLIDPKALIGKDPETNWQNAVTRLYNCLVTCRSSEEFVRTYLVLCDCMYDWLGKLHMSRHLKEIMMQSVGENVDTNDIMEKYIHAGWKTAISDPRIQQLVYKYRVSDTKFQQYQAEYKTTERTAKISHCPYCDFGYPLIKGVALKLCPSCGNRLTF